MCSWRCRLMYLISFCKYICISLIHLNLTLIFAFYRPIWITTLEFSSTVNDLCVLSLHPSPRRPWFKLNHDLDVACCWWWKQSSWRSQRKLRKRWMDCKEDEVNSAGISRHSVTTGGWVMLQKTEFSRESW